MEFSKRKLPKEAENKLRQCPIATIRPYAMMIGPVYAFMKANEKFVSIKAPLDFFSPAELEKFKSFECFYFPEFTEAALPFRQAARATLALLSWDPGAQWQGPRKNQICLTPACYETSDAVLRIIGPLWTDQVAIEPFFVSVFANELCELLPSELLTQAREQSVATYENAVFAASWAVFLALHLGHCELAFLNRIRLEVFTAFAQGRPPAADFAPVAELYRTVQSSFSSPDPRSVSDEVFALGSDRVSQKIRGRLKRVRLELVREGEVPATIFGERGFVDV